MSIKFDSFKNNLTPPPSNSIKLTACLHFSLLIYNNLRCEKMSKHFTDFLLTSLGRKTGKKSSCDPKFPTINSPFESFCVSYTQRRYSPFFDPSNAQASKFPRGYLKLKFV